MSLSTYGVSRETQLRVLKLIKVVIEGKGREMYEFGYKTMKTRWDQLSKSVSMSKRFSIQDLETHYCSFSGKVKKSSPGNSLQAIRFIKLDSWVLSNCNLIRKKQKFANIIDFLTAN